MGSGAKTIRWELMIDIDRGDLENLKKKKIVAKGHKKSAKNPPKPDDSG